MSMIRKRSHPSGGSAKKEKAAQPETGKLAWPLLGFLEVSVGGELVDRLWRACWKRRVKDHKKTLNNGHCLPIAHCLEEISCAHVPHYKERVLNNLLLFGNRSFGAWWRESNSKGDLEKDSLSVMTKGSRDLIKYLTVPHMLTTQDTDVTFCVLRHDVNKQLSV